MRQRRRQALRHHLHVDDTEQFAFVQRDVAHQILALRFDALFITLAVVRLIELGYRQGHNHLHVTRRDAGLKQRVMHRQQV
ncbi:hypothetical protein D3C87_1871030 [compost metagenome]